MAFSGRSACQLKTITHIPRPDFLMINRRDFLGITLGAGATLTLTPELLRALERQGGRLIQRAIPSTGEMVPVISYGPRPTDGGAIREILKTLADNGGKIVDVLHGGPEGERGARTAANDLGITNKFFWTTPLSITPPAPPGSPPPPKPTPDAVRAAMEAKFAAFKVPTIDLVMVGAGNDPVVFATLREMKKEGKIRYIGAHDLATPPYPPNDAFGRLEAIMRNEQVDFIGTDYMAGWRGAEERLLPLALERKVAFMAYFPFDRGRVFKRVGDTPLPAWAADFDAKTWAQFFLKYVLSHPAVVVAREGTTNPVHMLDNIGGGIGRLPDEATRKRMAQLVDSLPPTPPPGPPLPPAQQPGMRLSAAFLERYVSEWKLASGTVITFRRDGATLLVKGGTMTEAALNARSETRLQDPRGPIFEFQVDAAGTVTGLILEQGNPVQRIPLTRVR
jgi:aryl-alcohol dehydrogenase-like predicted oxidoreductase